MDSARLQKAIGYQFNDLSLLRLALTHRSVGAHNNERLEFLGDAILDFEVAENLYHLHPQASEGLLSRSRALLVKEETLAELARELGLGKYLILGTGEMRSGGQSRGSILADALEALIAAVYLDGGIEQARALVRRLLGARIQASSPSTQMKDPKTRLQELLQSNSQALPVYEVDSIEGDAHAQTFNVSCILEHKALRTQASGTSRKRAEQEAAEAMLALLENMN